jgi:hypothetical protein
MPACKTERQERFAHFIAQGMSQIDAYEAAGYSRCGKAASLAARKPGVAARVQELRYKAVSRAQVTLESLLEKAEDARVLAMQNGQPGAAILAIKEIGILSGIRVEKRNTMIDRPIEQLTDDELTRIARGEAWH